MTKKKSEQDDLNKERLVDIVLVIQYMESLDVDKEFFTDQGTGFLKGLASNKDEIKFVSEEVYNNAREEIKQLSETIDITVFNLEKENSELKTKYNDLLRKNNTKKRGWLK